MTLSIRQSQIFDIARTEGRVAVDDLSDRLNVTAQTIRRDLSVLAQAGKLDRVHGGAVIRAGVVNIAYEERRRLNEDAKAAIARACAAAVPNNSSLFVNLGSTTEAVAHELLNHQNITVVTNNMQVSNILVANESCEIVIAGGLLRRADCGLVGDLTSQIISQFKVDFAIVGTSAIDEDGDLLDFDLQEIRVSKVIIGHARKTYLVADSSKLSRRAPARIASLADIDAIFTDQPLPPDLARKCAEWNTGIHVVE